MPYWYANCSIVVARHALRGWSLKHRSKLLVAVVVAQWLAGCGDGDGDAGASSGQKPLPTAATLGEQTVLPATEYLASDRYARADRSRGERQAQVCKACHSFDRGGPNMIGPALYGFFGTEVGTHSGFEYSQVLRNADFVWTPEAVDAWLAQPGRFLPGNRMTFAGVPGQQDRDDLVAWLLEATTAENDD